MGFLRRKPAAGGREAPERRTGSVYAERFRDNAEQDGHQWVPVAESDPVTGALRWLPGWERRAQGWVPLDELWRGL
jgi:hypothetical protein